MDTLVSMNVFRYVVEVGSFVGAAERMQMSAAMASKHVMHLEQQLGARLLHRTTRRVAPTEAGREYYERLVQALTELDEAGQAVGAASVVPQGRLRVTSLSAFGLRHVMQAVTDYAARFADVTVEITLSDRVVELIDEGYDVAVRAAPFGLKSSSLVARQIATAHILLVASPAYLEEHGTPATLADLEQHNYLRRDAGSSSIDAQAFDSRVTLSGNLIVNHLEALRVAVLSGSGHRHARHRGGGRRHRGRPPGAAAARRDAAARTADLCRLREPPPRLGEGALVRRLPRRPLLRPGAVSFDRRLGEGGGRAEGEAPRDALKRVSVRQ